MALDLFVMPLYRYLAGDFKTATERFVEEQAAGAKYIRVGAKPNASVEEAREFVRVLRLRLRESLGGEIRWHDEGETVYARQFDRDAWHALRAFAADQAAPVPGFSFKDDPQRHPNLEPVYNGKPSAFVHLIRHNDVNGMYLPCDFDRPFALPMFDGEPVTPVIGSSLRLLKELNALGSRLGLSADEGQDGWTEQFVSDDPSELPKSGWVALRHAVRTSVAHKLPLIFDG